MGVDGGRKRERGEGVNLLRGFPQHHVNVWSVQCVFRGFHAVTKTPVRPAYLPCSKTREGVYPAVKVERGLSGIRFRAASDSLFCMCRQGKPNALVPLFKLSYVMFRVRG